ncbi:hypothetical protein HIM_11599 [Hirsutella minnesotensis 3608]|uniref:Uncharacterized protein n=1 Tax=Hirsutella minnesotensis 3608 TaxID=1043627 RepID=A0A0F7ZIX7_9HYPO|nr:hypothetical protein HIM_11599 [Hirsutella minnesotensis 3608]
MDSIVQMDMNATERAACALASMQRVVSGPLRWDRSRTRNVYPVDGTSPAVSCVPWGTLKMWEVPQWVDPEEMRQAALSMVDFLEEGPQYDENLLAGCVGFRPGGSWACERIHGALYSARSWSSWKSIELASAVYVAALLAVLGNSALWTGPYVHDVHRRALEMPDRHVLCPLKLDALLQEGMRGAPVDADALREALRTAPVVPLSTVGWSRHGEVAAWTTSWLARHAWSGDPSSMG